MKADSSYSYGHSLNFFFGEVMACDQKHKWAHTYYPGAYTEWEIAGQRQVTPPSAKFPMAQAIQFFPSSSVVYGNFGQNTHIHTTEETYL